MPSRVEVAIAKFRAQVLAEETQATQAVLAAYQPARERLIQRIDALIRALQDRPLTASEIKRWDRAQALFAQMEQEIARLAGIANGQITDTQGRLVALAGESAKALTLAGASSAATIAAVDGAWNQLKPDDVEALVGRMSDGSPLRETLAKHGPEAGRSIAEALQRAVALSTNPRGTAAELARTVDIEAWKLLRITRTETLTAYRTATLANYRANDDIVDGWRWICAQQTRTCLACLALDDRLFPLSVEFQPSHPNCRCSSLAEIKGEPRTRFRTGQQYFASLPDSVKQTMMPAAAFEDYKAGRLQLADFAHLRTDPDWGDSYVQASTAQARESAKRRGVTFPRTPATAPSGPVTVATAPRGATAAAPLPKPKTPTPAPMTLPPPPDGTKARRIPKGAASTKPATAAEIQTVETRQQTTPPAGARATLQGELSDTEDFALNDYRSFGFRVNRSLRQGANPRTYDTDLVANLDAMIARSTLNEDTVVYRGLAGFAFGVPSKSVGMTIMDQGFMSTSTDRAIAHEFATKSEGGVIVKMLVPGGSNALDIQAFSPHSTEQELLLPRNTKLRVVAYRGDVNPPELDVEIVP